jgi:hypothetical protein
MANPVARCAISKSEHRFWPIPLPIWSERRIVSPNRWHLGGSGAVDIADDRLQLRGQLRHWGKKSLSGNNPCTAFSFHLLAEAPMTGLEKHSVAPHATGTPGAYAGAGSELKPESCGA